MHFFKTWIIINIVIWIMIGILPFGISALRGITEKSHRQYELSDFEGRWLSSCGTVLAMFILVQIGSWLPKMAITSLLWLTGPVSFALLLLAVLPIIAPDPTRPDAQMPQVNRALVAILVINFCTLCFWLGGHYA